MEKRMYKKGDLVCRENTSGDEMFIILSGSVKVYKTVNQDRIDLAALGRDDFFGELCLLLGCPRTATVEALEPSQLLIINKETLLKNIQDDPKLARRMLTRMAKRLKESNDIITRLEGEVSSLRIIYSSG